MNTYDPDSVSPLGDTLREMMKLRRWDAREVSERTGLLYHVVVEILDGRRCFNAFEAERLGEVFEVRSDFLLRRQAAYRATLGREKE